MFCSTRLKALWLKFHLVGLGENCILCSSLCSLFVTVVDMIFSLCRENVFGDLEMAYSIDVKIAFYYY